jgi:signal peptidase II
MSESNPMKSTVKRLSLLIGLTTLTLAVDQIAKWQVITNLELYESWRPIPALYPFFRVTRSFNTGAAFGMFPMGSNVFMVLAIIATVVFTIMYLQVEHETFFSLTSMPLIIGGALGNAIDRIRFDHVVDFFHIQIGNFANISNFADHAIVLGVILLLIDQWQVEMREKEAAQQAEPLPTAEQLPPYGGEEPHP